MYEALLKATPEYQKIAESLHPPGPAALFGLPPAGRSKHIFTEWGSTGKLHLCSLMHFEVTPPLVKKQQRKARRLFSAANKK